MPPKRTNWFFSALYILADFVMYFALPCNAQPQTNPTKIAEYSLYQSEWSFVENKGQLASQNKHKGYDLHPEIKYYGNDGAVSLYCKPGAIGFLFSKTERTDTAGIPKDPIQQIKNKHKKGIDRNLKVSAYNAELLFVNANPEALI